MRGSVSKMVLALVAVLSAAGGCALQRTAPGLSARMLYVSLREGQAVVGIDPESGKLNMGVRLPAVIDDEGALPADPADLTLWPERSLAIASCINTGRLALIDLWDSRLARMIPVPRLSGPTIFAPGAPRLYVGTWTKEIAIVDVETPAVVDHIDVGAATRSLALSADGSRLYATTNTDEVLAIDPAAHAVVARVAVGTMPNQIALRPQSREAYVVLGRAPIGKVAVLDVDTLKTTKSIEVGAEPVAVLFAADGARAYVLNRESRTISVIDAATGSVTTTFSATGQTGAFLLSPKGDEIFVSHPDRSAISVLAAADGKLLRVLDVSFNGKQWPWSMAMSP